MASHLHHLPASALLSQGFFQNQGQARLHNFWGSVQNSNSGPLAPKARQFFPLFRALSCLPVMQIFIRWLLFSGQVQTLLGALPHSLAPTQPSCASARFLPGAISGGDTVEAMGQAAKNPSQGGWMAPSSQSLLRCPIRLHLPNTISKIKSL